MMFKRRFTPREKIELLQRWVLVHGYLYYNLDKSIVSDHKYDENCRQLVDLKLVYPTDWINSRYAYAMYDFDGSTGFGFMERLRECERQSVMFDIALLTDNLKR